MILCIADIHLGHKMHSSILENGLTTSEEDTRNALDSVKQRAACDDIEMIICSGDFFHSSRPSAENIKWAITWFKEIDTLGKPFYIIPGNHDITIYSNSLVFLKSLNTHNIHLIDDGISSIVWKDWSIYFIPFLAADSSKNKYASTLEALTSVMSVINSNTKSIIVAHIQESTSRLGTENMMLSRSVETINIDTFFDTISERAILLMGHMHMHQIYNKNDMTIVYPGSLTYMESLDCGQKKGYILLDQNGNIKFEEIQNIRKYKQYILPENKNPVEFFSSIELESNEVIFLKSHDDVIIDDSELNAFLKTQNCKLAKISYTFNTLEEEKDIEVSEEEKNPLLYLEEWVSKECKDNKEDIAEILKLGKEYLFNEIEYD